MTVLLEKRVCYVQDYPSRAFWGQGQCLGGGICSRCGLARSGLQLQAIRC